MRKFIEYIVVLIVFFVLVSTIEWSNQYMKSLIRRTFDHAALGALVQVIGLFLFGLFLGSLNFVREFKKVGYWKVNRDRLLALGLPLMIILLMVYIPYLGITWPQMIQKLLFFIMTSSSLINFIAIFLGYIVISSFTKESGTVINEKSQVNKDNPQGF